MPRYLGMRLFMITSLLFLTTCSKEICYKKTLVKPRHILEAQSLRLKGESWVTVLRGKRPVVLSAPHAFPVSRKKGKYADRGTGELAVLLHRLTDVTVIYTSGEPPCDPNNDDKNVYKEVLSALINEIKPKLVIDLHRAHQSRPFDIDYGTLHGLSCQRRTLNKITACLREEGLSNFTSNTFSASRNLTITKWAYRHKTEAFQLEINSTWLNFNGDPLSQQRFAQLLQGLTIFLTQTPIAP